MLARIDANGTTQKEEERQGKKQQDCEPEMKDVEHPTACTGRGGNRGEEPSHFSFKCMIRIEYRLAEGPEQKQRRLATKRLANFRGRDRQWF